ncbi:MAG: PAS domain-containing protein [Leptolyngbyaceae cyanobacterium bins.59]|nr:PAS domain-containing protein [Leptolyngbyaceae cyanobacterium bins.59]
MSLDNHPYYNLSSTLQQGDSPEKHACKPYELLNTLDEGILASILRLVCRVLEIPVAFVVLTSPSGITLNTAQGIDLAAAKRFELPAAIVQSPTPVYSTPETQVDGLAIQQWTIATAPCEFFASFPLKTPQNCHLGCLCLLDVQTRTFSPEQITILNEFTGLIVEELDLQLTALRNREVETALRDSEAEIRALFAALDDVILVLDADGRYLKVAPTNPRLLHVPVDRKVGKTLHEIFPESQADIFLSLVRYALETKERVSAEYSLQLGGEEVFFSTNISPLSDNQVVWVARDVTERQQAEETLQSSVAQIRLIMDSVPARIAYVDKDQHYRFVNRRYEEWFQLPAEEIVGKQVRDLCGEPIYRGIRSKIETVLQGSPVTYEDSMISQKGEEYYVQVTYVPHFHEEEVLGYYVLMQDITDRKRAEVALRQSEERFRSLIQDLQVGVLLQGPNAEILLCNQAALDLLGVSESQLLGRTSFNPNWNVIHEDGSPFPSEDHPVPQAIARKQSVENVVMGVYHPQRSDRVWLLVNAKPDLTADGAVKQVLCTFSDISELKRAQTALLRSEAELRQLNQDLEQRVQERTEALAQMNDQLRQEITEHERTEAALHQVEEELRQSLNRERELSNLKSRFITTVSHEFRTPLTILLTSVELLKRYKATWPAEKSDKYYERMRGAIDKMTAILNDILTLAKMEAGKSQCSLAPINLQVFCQELITELKEENGIQNPLEFIDHRSTLDDVWLDAELLWNILSQLLMNAVKYSTPDLPVQLILSRDAETVTFQIQDTGLGIPQEDLPYIFDSFHRASNVVNIPGTGLGLAIVNRCVGLHGGQTTVQSEMGAGTTVTVTLPLLSGISMVHEADSGH